MQVNFFICLISSSNQNNQKSTTTSPYLSSGSPIDSSYNDKSSRSITHNIFTCTIKFLRRFCFCFVICLWSVSFTATIPLLYSIDSNEKNPQPVYCPGTLMTIAEEWFDESRLIQSILFYLMPFIISSLLTLISLLKLFSDCLLYCCQNYCSHHFSSRKTSKKKLISTGISKKQKDGCGCYCCRQNGTLSYYDTPPSIHYSPSMMPNLGIITNNNNTSVSIPDHQWPSPSLSPTSSTSSLSSSFCCSSTFLKFLLVLSCNVLATIYPIAMRFYLVYFSILIPLIFAVLNYSLNNLVINTNDTVSPTKTSSNTVIVPPKTMINCYTTTKVPIRAVKQLRTKSNVNENRVTSDLLQMKTISSANENANGGGEDEEENDLNNQQFLLPSSLRSSNSGTTTTTTVRRDIISIRQCHQKQYRQNLK
ncbi:unnamed protein product [Didymodactylos carnosus]|nr:unnamed protein product [Didymodactylos carnosus]CAF4183084.1 unnamed protein product [Didymodactylos carnosus]